MTVHRLSYRTLPVGRRGRRNTLESPGVESVLIVEAVLDEHSGTESGEFKIVLNPAPARSTICRHGKEASVDIFCPDRWV